ncbi:hypothetical protein [Amycolatopsis vancoresmycina]|uniref:Uncharacterized protein n=1 Tax=Amycolatopsis vancoresmycina DSM 44592 TaxID=1292037 RepID=R1HTN1_9PSEU|nr:hypothetical protein [Amycolatopsis vancoresmycina]EOD66895.1 hypothetical protein H480_19268 [Amycolatopsis vancoresmycina DSM 44592]
MPRKPGRPEKRPCAGRSTSTGQPCKNSAIRGGTVCTVHGGRAPQVAAKAAVRAELENWGLGDTNVDPGEVLLKLVSQSAARAERYARLLEEAYDAAERLKTAHEAELLLVEDEPDGWDDEERPERAATQAARADLRRIFSVGGVAALVGHTYDSSKDGGIYATGEQIRGLADLEAKERDRCANFAAKAVAAGLATRQVELAERQGALVAQLVLAVFDELGLTDEQREAAPDVLERHLRLVAS